MTIDLEILYFVTRVATILIVISTFLTVRKIIDVKVTTAGAYIVSILYVCRAVVSGTTWDIGMATAWVVLVCTVILYPRNR
jgi:hypothetical protein